MRRLRDLDLRDSGAVEGLLRAAAPSAAAMQAALEEATPVAAALPPSEGVAASTGECGPSPPVGGLN